MTVAPRARISYTLLLGFVVALVTASLLLSKAYFGWYPRPSFFSLFRTLHFLQLGLLDGVAVAALVHLAGRSRRAALRALLVVPALVSAGWLVVWALVHATFGIRLSVPQVWELITEPRTIQLVGLVRGQLLLVIAALLLAAAGLAWLIQRAASGSGAAFTRRVLRASVAAFLTVHLAVRAYFAYHIAHNQRAVLVLDEASPLPLRTEALIPGLRARRMQFPSLEDSERTRAYLSWAAGSPGFELPHKPAILWITVESLRFDAIGDSTMPYLFAHREEFQLRRGGDHWSGGDATKPGIFTMLTGLAAYHLQEFRNARIAFPLLTALASNGYRVRIAKGLSFYYGDLRAFLPASAIVGEVSAPSMPAGDRAMIDSLLADLGRRGPGPAFDFLTFDATHWPYDDPEVYRTVGPSRRPERIYRAVRSPEAVRLGRLRYQNSVRFVDSEIARLLERLRATRSLDSTIVIVTGDHGEEFLERGQLGHSGAMNDFQARVPLWIRFPTPPSPLPGPAGLTSNLDILPTLLDYLGLEADQLRTQGRSLLRPQPLRKLLMLAEQGWSEPLYHALIGETYVSRWRKSGKTFLFSSVERRDGAPVTGDAWWREVEAERPAAALEYEVLPDVRSPPRPFREP